MVRMPEQPCVKCGGSGWILVERDGLSGAERCDCVEEDRSQRLEENAGIPPLYANASLENFQNFGNPGLSEVQNIVRGYTREYPFLAEAGPAADRGAGHREDASGRRRAAPADCQGFRGDLLRLPEPAGQNSLGLRRQLRFERPRGLPGGDGMRDSAARRPRRAPRHRVGGGHRDLHRHLPLQQQEGAHRDHQPGRLRTRATARPPRPRK